MVSAVYQVTCGLSTTLSIAAAGCRRPPARPRTRRDPRRPASRHARLRQAQLRRRSAPREVLTSTAPGFIRASASRSSRCRRLRGQRQVQRDDVAGRQQLRQYPPVGSSVVSRAGVQDIGAHGGGDRHSPAWRCCRSRPGRPCSRRYRAPSSPSRDPTASPALARFRVLHRQATHRGEHQQNGALGDRGRVGAGHVGHGDAAVASRRHVDGVDPAPSLCTSRQRVARPGRRPTAAAARARGPPHRAARGRKSRRRPRRNTGCRANRIAGQRNRALCRRG